MVLIGGELYCSCHSGEGRNPEKSVGYCPTLGETQSHDANGIDHDFSYAFRGKAKLPSNTEVRALTALTVCSGNSTVNTFFGTRHGLVFNSERTNLQVVYALCALMDERHPVGAPHEKRIQFVKDRPGHDCRYAIDASKIKRELGFAVTGDFRNKFRGTVVWYVEHEAWSQLLLSPQV